VFPSLHQHRLARPIHLLSMSSMTSDLPTRPRRTFLASSSAGDDDSIHASYGIFEAFGTSKSFYLPGDAAEDRHKPNLVRLLAFLAGIGVNVFSTNLIQLDFNGQNGEELGSGAFKKVRLGSYEGRAVAVKALKVSPMFKTGNAAVDATMVQEYHSLIQDILMEIRVMSHVALSQHPNLVDLVAVAFEDVPDSSMRVDFFRPILLLRPSDQKHPDLRRLLDDPQTGELFTDDFAISLICDIADGLAALHTFGVVHADLKPENILLYTTGEQVTAKISDFGLSGVLQSRDLAGAGDRVWRPPERLSSRSASPQQLGDVFTFGLLAASIYLKIGDPWPVELKGVELDHFRLKPGDSVCSYLCHRILTRNAEELATFGHQEKMLTLVNATVARSPSNRIKNLSLVRPFLSGE